MDCKKFAYFTLFLLSAGLNEVRASTNDSSSTGTDILNLHVISRIQSRFAITSVNSQVRNADDKAREIVFQAQLPEEAFITNFSMQIKDKIIFGDVKEKEKAKQAYQTAVDRGQSAGLVAEVPRATNNFQISVNVGAKEKVIFNLTYQEVLKRTHGVYKHVINLQPLQNVNDLKVEVIVNEQGRIKDMKVPKFGPKMGEKSNLELLNETEQEDVDLKLVAKDSISHAHLTYVPKRPTNGSTISGQLVVLYDVVRDGTGGVVQVMDGYFVHFFSPSGLKPGPKNIIFVLDKSGSMIGRKFEQTKVAMKRILSELDDQDRFDIIMFADTVEIWKREFVPANAENKKKAKLFVDDTEAGGGTDIFEALERAIGQLKPVSQSKSVLSSMIVFLTDGEPTVGVTDGDVIVRNISALNSELKYALHSLAFGQYADYRLVQRLSRQNFGLARKIYEDADADLQLTGFYGEIASPLLTNVHIEYLNDTVDVSTLVQSGEYNLYEGGEFMVVGKLKEPDVPINPLFDVQIDAKSLAGPASYFARSQPIACRPDGFQIVEGDILVPCCHLPFCPPPRPPLVPEKTPTLLPALSLGGFIERMWAYQTVKKLLKSVELEKTDGQEQNAANQKALQLSLKYKFVTPLTSMVVVQPEEEGDNSTTNATTQAPIELKPVPVRDSAASSYDHVVYGQSASMAIGHYNIMPDRSGHYAQSLMGPPPPQYALTNDVIEAEEHALPAPHPPSTDQPQSGHMPVIVFLDVTPNCSTCLANLAYLRNLKNCLRTKGVGGQAAGRSIFVNLNLAELNHDGTGMNIVSNYTGPNEEIYDGIEEFRSREWEEFVGSSRFMKTLDQLTTDGGHLILIMTGDGPPDKAETFQQTQKHEKTKVYLVHLADTNTQAWKALVSNDERMFFTGGNSFADLCAVL